MVTTWPPRFCGIATYSDELVTALRQAGADVEIICHKDGGRPGEPKVHPVIDMTKPGWYYPLYQAVELIQPDVIHIQHEYGIYSTLLADQMFYYGPDRSFTISDPLFRFQIERKPVVVTYHSVFSHLKRNERIYLDVTTKLAAANILHEPYQAESLPANLVRETPNVFVIQHGAPEYDQLPDGKAEYGLSGKKVLGVVGWWEPNKCIPRVISWWPEIKADLGDDAVLVVAGDARPGSPGGLKAKPEILEAIDSCPQKDSIITIMGCFTPQEYALVMSSFDLLVLPYSEASQSGNLAHAYSVGVPSVVSAIEGLKSSIEDSGAGVAIAGEDHEYMETIIGILRNEPLQKQLSAKARAYVRDKISWPQTVTRHFEVYEWAQNRIEEN